MPSDLRPAIVLTLTALGSAMLAVAAIDWLAYTFVQVDILSHEARLHGESSLRRVPSWFDLHDSVAYRSLQLCAGFGLITAAGAAVLARIRRAARLLLGLAAGFTALAVGIVVATHRDFFAASADQFYRGPRDYLHRSGMDFEHWRSLSAEELGVAVAGGLIVVLALALVRVAVRRGVRPAYAWWTAAAFAAPAALAFAVLTLLWATYGQFAAVGHDGWADLIHTCRFLPCIVVPLIAAVSLWSLRDGPTPGRTRVALAAGLLALGGTALFATEPHRRTIDAFYPLVDPGAPVRSTYKLDTPWAFDAPVRGRCLAHKHYDDRLLTIRVDEAGHVVATDRNRHADLGDEAAVAGLLASLQGWRGWADPTQPFVLLSELDVPVSALARLLPRLPMQQSPAILVAGMFIQTMPSIDGPVTAASLCVIGRISPTAVLDPGLAPDATWRTIVDDPALMDTQPSN